MKIIISALLIFFSSFAIQAELGSLKISIEEAKELLGKNLGDEIFLKERLKLEDAARKAGEIMGHKVGNGFQIPGPNPKIKPIIDCQVLGSNNLVFSILKTDSKQLVAVLSSDPTKTNIAEFLNVEFVERSAGFKRYMFYTGTNPLRGEMFQLELMNNGFNVLRIVTGEQLYHFKVSCIEKKERE